MQGLESIDTTNEGTSVLKSNEWIGTTEVCRFEGCEALNNEQLADYVRETIPPSHLEGCPLIEYDPENAVFVNFPETLGFYECDSHAIHIANENRFPEGREGVEDTMVHEIGHNAYAGIVENNPELAAQWEALNTESWQKYALDGTGFVSSYAMTSKYEDFAESYKTYIRDPERLQVFNEDKYVFMNNYVFSGREYLSSSDKEYTPPMINHIFLDSVSSS